MTDISHEQAQSHLQARADRRLAPGEAAALEAHLENCASCRDYARSLGGLETALRQVLHARWGGVFIPVPVQISGRARGLPLLRFAGAPIVVLVVVAFLATLTILPFSLATVTETPRAAVPVLAVPTPSTPLTITLASTSGCEPFLYEVQAGDTLEGIAQKFSLPKEAIMQANNMDPEEVTVSGQLLIPACIPTPSHTPTTTLSRTVTPSIVTASRTP